MMRVIIIGGTGMLSTASQEIAYQAKELILIAREPDDLAGKIGARALKMNWKDAELVMSTVSQLELETKVDIVLSWIHDDGLWCLPLFEKLLINGGRSIRIHGSAVGDPSQGVKTDPVPSRQDIIRQHVVLGWIEDSEKRRWLTDDEISEGALMAFKNRELTSIVIGEIKNADLNETNSESIMNSSELSFMN